MNIGYGINRQVKDFAKASLDTFTPLSAGEKPQPRIWVDTDLKVRPQFSEMLMLLRDGDVVHVVTISDLGKGFDLAENKRKIEAQGGSVCLVEAAAPPTPPRKPGPKPQWLTIPDIDVTAISEKWHNPNIYTWQAAISEAHKRGHEWVKRHHLNDNLGTRNAPKSKEPS